MTGAGTGLGRRLGLRGLGALLIAVSCCCSSRTDFPALDSVELPPELDQLEPAVQAQFRTLRGRLAALSSKTGTDGTEVGRAWGELGQWFDLYKYPDSAAICYRHARSLAPEEPRWPYYLALLAGDRGDLEGARAALEEVVRLAPEAAAPWVRLGDLALEGQHLDRAEALYRKVLERHPESVGALYGLARVALQQGDPRAALEPLEAVALQQPEASEIQYLLGLAWSQLGETGRGKAHWSRVPKENIDHVPLRREDPWVMELHRKNLSGNQLTRQGLRAYHRGQFGRAAVFAGRAVNLNPEDVELRVNYAQALRRMGRPRAAMEQLQSALRLDPRHRRAHLSLGALHLAEGRLVAAESHLEAALSVDPQSAPVHLQLGQLRQRQGRLEEAVHHYAVIRRSGRARVDVRFWHAALLVALERWEEAHTALSEDLRGFPHERSLRLLQARILAAAPEPWRGGAEEAGRYLAGLDGPKDVLYAETAAMIAAEAGRWDDAVSWQSSAVEALAGVRPRSASHIARRRLVLYRHGEACGKPWEPDEVAIHKPVLPPGGLR